MKVEQISIFIENKSGRLAEVSGVLGKAGVNIRALSLADTSDFGILRLIVDDTDTSLQVLREKNFTVSKTEVIGVEVPDTPGGISTILQVLDDNDVNVEYMYAFANPQCKNAIMIFRFDDYKKAIELLDKYNIKVIGPEEIAKL